MIMKFLPGIVPAKRIIGLLFCPAKRNFLRFHCLLMVLLSREQGNPEVFPVRIELWCRGPAQKTVRLIFPANYRHILIMGHLHQLFQASKVPHELVEQCPVLGGQKVEPGEQGKEA
jgi:hypothetical protein